MLRRVSRRHEDQWEEKEGVSLQGQGPAPKQNRAAVKLLSEGGLCYTTFDLSLVDGLLRGGKRDHKGEP